MRKVKVKLSLYRPWTSLQGYRRFRPPAFIATQYINSLNAELNPICHLLALLGAHPILHISRISVKVGIVCKRVKFNLNMYVLLVIQSNSCTIHTLKHSHLNI